jgi:hypothetical protein
MNFAKMQEMALEIIQDDSYADKVGGYINEAFLQAAGRVNLPDLKRLGTLNTIPGQMFASLRGVSGGFNGRIAAIVGDLGFQRFEDLNAMVNDISFYERDTAEVGPVEFLALEGHTLWYFPSPATSQSIMAILYGNPLVLSADEDIPTAFPDIVHFNIGVHGACYFAYDQIEDGIEDAKVNTASHYALFQKGVTDLMEWAGKNKKHNITSIMNV